MRRCLYAAVAATVLVSRWPDVVSTGLVALAAVAAVAVAVGLFAAFRPRVLSW